MASPYFSLVLVPEIPPSMSRHRTSMPFLLIFSAILLPSRLATAQDTRTVTEPVFPSTCTTLAAELQQTGNVLPSADEMLFDTSRLQQALNACTSGQAVELTPGANGDNAFLIQPITIPTGVTLLVDAGVTVYGSRNPRDYDAIANECGTVASYSSGCNALITVKANNVGIMGYGVIDGRGGQTLIGPGAPSNTTWWQLSNQAQTANLNQNNPRLVNIDANNFTLYKITLQNSPFFHVNYEGNGLTVWDVKIIAPGTARNTDGIDPGPAQNVTVTQSYIGDGDDNIALKPGGTAVAGGTASNVSILHNHFYVGHGMSIGSQTSGGSTNVLVQDLNIDGDPTNGSDTGIRIKAESSDGGLVNGVTYKQVCMQNVVDPIQFNPFYSASTGSDYPQFQNITLSNVTVLTAGKVLLEGYSANYPLGLTLDNVNFTPALPANDVTASNAGITLGPGPVNLPVTTNSANNVTVTSNITNLTETPYACNSANFPLLAPEFFGSASQLTVTQPITLTAIFEPVIESPTTFVATEPTGTVTFFDGTTSVGSVTLSGTTDLASLTLATESAGSHSYTAVYSGDTNYSTITTQAFAVTVSLLPSSTNLAVSPLQVSAGSPVVLTATVTSSAGGTPTGTVNFLNGGTLVGSETLDPTGVAKLTLSNLSPGANAITAAYQGDTSYQASTSQSVAVNINAMTTMVLTASSLTVNAGQTIQLTATVTTGSGTPGGSVAFLDGPTTLSTITLNSNGTAAYTATLSAGTHTLTASYTPIGDYGSSASTAQTAQVQDFSILASPATLTLSPGGAGSSTLTFTGLGGLAGTVSYSCSGLPAYISCTSGTATLSATSTATLTITVATTLAAIPAIWLLLTPVLALLGAGRKRRQWARLATLAGIALLGGCGGSVATSNGSQTPPTGLQTATIMATTSTPSGTINHSTIITVNVQ